MLIDLASVEIAELLESISYGKYNIDNPRSGRNNPLPGDAAALYRLRREKLARLDSAAQKLRAALREKTP